MSLADKIRDLEEKTSNLMKGGGDAAVAKQRSQGKMTARERIDVLLDSDSFRETDLFARHRCTDFDMAEKEIPADGVITGFGTVDGRKVFVYSQDFTAAGGAMGAGTAKKICKIMDMAMAAGAPVIGIIDSGGARIQEGVDSLSGYGQIFFRNSRMSGRVPQISVIAGPCAGGAAYSPALTDIVIMVEKTGKMFITGPSVIEVTTGEVVDEEELGGAFAHASVSGVAHLTASDEKEALRKAASALSYLPSSDRDRVPYSFYAEEDESRPALEEIVPDDERIPYDMKDVIAEIFDKDSFFELQPLFADNLITGFARLGGLSVGVIANQPYSLGGCLDISASVKGARFIRMCDAFNLPLVNLVDVPGFMPGVDQEHSGIIRHGAKMLYAYSVAEVPKFTVILRKAFGGSYLAMCSKDLGADLVLAWPAAQIAVMGAEGAAGIIFRREIAGAEDPEAKRAEMVEMYKEKFETPYPAAERGHADMVIRPRDTRSELLTASELFAKKAGAGVNRGNMPL
ncbi:MAG: acyl-CoA carboxylase subunit beta [Oscillospiraceae bacterium]|nr:acyl-CoA carboxylase subunit beta [Oscillospiraceae bacterium]